MGFHIDITSAGVLTLGCMFLGLHSASADSRPAAELISAIEQIRKESDPARRARETGRIIQSLKKQHDDGPIAALAAWNIARLYRDFDDDRILRVVVDARLDTGLGETFLGTFAHFLESDPAFLRSNKSAQELVKSERGALRPLVELKRMCKRDEAHLAIYAKDPTRQRFPARETGLLRAGTDGSARVSIDGKDTGLSTPIEVWDHVVVGPGHHRVSFRRGEATVDFDVAIEPGQNACLYQSLEH
jgi:hypothetical protein